MIPLQRLRTACLVFPLLLLFTGGCGEDCPTDPASLTGQIFGSVTGGGKPLHARVTARSTSFSSDRFATTTDSSGAYALNVLPGRYTISVLVEDIWCCAFGKVFAGSLSHTDADTFRVDEGNLRVQVDAALGSVVLNLETPGELEDREIQGFLRPEVSYNYVYSFADAVGGRVNLVFPAVLPGRFQMRFNAAGTGIWLPGSQDREGGEWITVEAGGVSVYEGSVPSPGKIRGSITGSWQVLNMARPHLMLYDADSTQVSMIGATWDGDFQLWAFAPTQARLAIWAGASWMWYGGDSFEDAPEFALEPGKIIDLDIVESGIAGVLGGGGSAFTEIHAHLHGEGGNHIAAARAVGEEGLFRFAGLLPGTYYLRFDRGPTWIAHWFNRADSFAEATPIVIRSHGEVVWLDPDLMEGAQVSGHVLDPLGMPILGAKVGVSSSVVLEIWPDRETRTRTEGTFALRALPDGSFTILAEVEGRGRIWYPGVADWDSAAVVTIENHEDVTGIVLQFTE